jgi:Tol biopolymer transport system component
MRIDGTGARQLTQVTVGSALNPAWNPVNDDAHRNQIVYTWDQGGSTGPQLTLTSPTGGDKPFFPGTGSTWQTGPASWLPDGSGVLFMSPNLPDGTLSTTQNLYRAPTCSCTPPQLLYSCPRAPRTPTWLGPMTGGGPVVEETSAAALHTADVEDVRPDGTDPRDLGISVLNEDPAADTDTNPADDPLFTPHPGFDPWFERQSYTPDGRGLVTTRFEDSPAGRIERIWLADADGANPHPMNLAGRGPTDWDTDPAFSPDGSLIAFTRTSPGGVGTASGPGRIMIAQVSTGAVVGTITPPAGQQTASEGEPSWSADGKLIAFTRTAVVNGNAGNRHIWTVSPGALDQQTDLSLTACPGACDVIDDSPVISPDGQRIAFNRKAGNGGVNQQNGMVVTSVTGTGCTVILPTGLSGDPGACRRPMPDTSATGPFEPRDAAWSANGAQLVLTSRRALPANSPEGLSSYDFATGKLTPIDWRLPGRQKEPGVQQSVDLSLSAPASTPPVLLGGSTTVPVTVANQGPAPSPGTVLTASVPSGARLTGLTTPVGQCDATALRCDLGTLAPGATVQITATVTGVQVGDQVLGWSLTGTVVDPNPGDNAAQTTVPVAFLPPPGSPPPSPLPTPTELPTPVPPAPAGPGVSISAQPNPGYVGGHVTVSYTVRNTGIALATGLRLTLGLPAQIPAEPLPAGCPGGVCQLGDLAPGGSEEVQVVLSPDAALQTTITATLTTTGTDAHPGPHTASTPLRILQPRIEAVPPIGKPGFVTSVRGKDFPPGVPVRFTWQPGITAAAAPTYPAADGTFAGQLLILPKDEVGPRTITASGPGFSAVTCPFLVVIGTIGPPEEVQRR